MGIGAVHYSSTDASAPVISGTANTLLAAIRACLVGTAGIAYGSKAAAGWTEIFTGTQKAVFQAPSGRRYALRVQDDGVNATAGARVAYLRAFDVATSVDAGNNFVPTVAQMADGVYLHKSATADAVARAWDFVVADTWAYFSVNASTTVGHMSHAWFGDFISDKPGDLHNVMLIGGGSVNTSGVSTGGLFTDSKPFSGGPPTTLGEYVARSVTGAAGAIISSVAGWITVNAGILGSGGSGVLATYPNQSDGGIRVVPVVVACESGIRGHLPGMYDACHSRPLAHKGDAPDISDPPAMSGRTVRMFYIGGNLTTVAGAILLDLTGPYT